MNVEAEKMILRFIRRGFLVVLALVVLTGFLLYMRCCAGQH
jgi:hypothetical protein